MKANVCKAMDIKSNYILKNLFKMISKSRYLDLINYNKALQSRIEIDINDYKNTGKKSKQEKKMEMEKNINYMKTFYYLKEDI